MTADQKAYANATKRLNDVSVITGDSFSVTLNTTKYYVLNQTSDPNKRDHDADGDNALISIDKSMDLNGNGTVDFRTGGDYKYGFEQFTTLKQPGYSSANNNGTYTQNINAASLSEGYHFISVIAFRHRSDGGPAVFTDFRKTIYIDRLPPVVAVDSNKPWDPAHPEDRDFYVKSTDKTANAVHTFLNLPANLTDAQIVAMVNGNK